MLAKALKLQEVSSFIFEWVKAPLVTASVVPSGPVLARKMVKDIAPDAEVVIELGPGTGVFTQALLERGVREEALVLVELNSKFAARLRKQYPKATVINGAAEALRHLDIRQADAVVSGLPLLSIRDGKVAEILRGVFEILRPEGVMVQFTYGYRCPVKPPILKENNLSAQRNSFTLINLPPASVYHIRKKSRKRSSKESQVINMGGLNA